MAADQESGSSVAPRAATLLIVEDDHFVALAAETALLDAGFEIAGIAATAEEAVAMASGAVPDLVIMDVTLAGRRDGVDAALELFAQYGVRCVFATAHTDPRTQARASAAQPFAWLPKPYQPEALVAAVRRSLRTLGK